MKKLLFRACVLSWVLILGSCFYSKAQWVSIPDTNFGKWLNTNGYTACLQGNSQVGWQMDTSCPAVVSAVSVRCASQLISNITGIEHFDNLDSLLCYSNQITFLPSLPAGLIYLSCHSNNIDSLPPLPTGLISLACGYNQISSLPTLPAGLTLLHCISNQISSLPALPAGLIELNCISNQISSLPALPSTLTRLYCSDNQISSLPALPAGLFDLTCSENQLTSLPELPDYLYSCYIYDNPLSCLPQLKTINSLRFANTNITCVPNYGNVSNSIPSISSFPICDIFNSHGCDVLSNISGQVYLENNNNCVLDTSGESGLRNIKIRLWKDTLLAEEVSTVGLGTYSFDVSIFNTYTITIDTVGLPFQIVCPVNGVDTVLVTALDSLHHNEDFAVVCKLGFDLAAWSIEGRFRPGDMRQVNIHVGSASNFYGINYNTGAGLSGTVTIVINGPATYVSPAPAALTPDNVSGNVISYNVPDFGNTNFNNSFNIMVQTDTTAQIGDSICFTVTVTPITGDDIPVNNIQTHCFAVVASFDPNDKQVYPLRDIDVNDDKWLTYTVNFQNTGTDTAIHIYITDTLDADLDASTFQLLAYSHQPLVQIKENAVRFNFPNIYLVDSNANELLSHGYVQYKIKIKAGKPVGTVINNTAYIYFDFNAPIITNTTSNTITCQPDLLMYSERICSGESFDFYGQSLTVPGTYMDTTSSQSGCDSIITLNLEVDSLPDVALAGNADSVCNNSGIISLTGGNPVGGIFSGDGVVGNSFNPAIAGAGAHIITYSYTDGKGCTNSATENIVVSICTAIGEIKDGFKISVYPNPATNLLNINLGGLQAEQVRIYNTDGRLVSDAKQAANNNIDISSFATGVYVAEVTVRDMVQRVRWVKM